jgi:hypothetical protein
MIYQHLLTTALFAIDPSYWRYVSQRSYPKRGAQLVWMDAFLMYIFPPFSTPVALVLQLHHLGEAFGTLGRWDLVWSGDIWFNVLPLFRNSRLNCVQCFFMGLKHVTNLPNAKLYNYIHIESVGNKTQIGHEWIRLEKPHLLHDSPGKLCFGSLPLFVEPAKRGLPYSWMSYAFPAWPAAPRAAIAWDFRGGIEHSPKRSFTMIDHVQFGLPWGHNWSISAILTFWNINIWKLYMFRIGFVLFSGKTMQLCCFWWA